MSREDSWYIYGRKPQVSYLGGQRLPVPQPAHCGPGFAGGSAAPAQAGTDVGFHVRDHLEPLRLGCGKQGRETDEQGGASGSLNKPELQDCSSGTSQKRAPSTVWDGVWRDAGLSKLAL